MTNSSVPIIAGSGTNIDTVTMPGGDHRQVVVLGSHGECHRLGGHYLFQRHRLGGTLPLMAVRAGTFITQEIGARLLTAVGYEPNDRMEFLNGDDEVVTLRAL